MHSVGLFHSPPWSCLQLLIVLLLNFFITSKLLHGQIFHNVFLAVSQFVPLTPTTLDPIFLAAAGSEMSGSTDTRRTLTSGTILNSHVR